MTIRSIGTFTAGALLASTLTFTGMQSWQAGAAPGDDDTTFVPVAPCRLLDTRTGPDNVGIRVAPLGPGEKFPTQVTGSNGECIGIPNDATAVALNVTTVNPTADSFLTLFPADLATPPKASNLNWVAGQSPTPNKVDVKLSPDGKVKIYNNTGTVDVIADIVGYYTPSSLTELEARLHALETNKPFTVRSNRATEVAVPTGSGASMASVVVAAPSAGTVTLFASATVIENTAGWNVGCVISQNLSVGNFLSGNVVEWEAAGPTEGSSAGEGDGAGLVTTRSFDISGPGNTTFHFACVNRDGTGSTINSPVLVALFTPA